MRTVQTITFILRASLELASTAVIVAVLFIFLPWTMNDATGNLGDRYEFVPLGSDREVRVTLAMIPPERVVDGEADDAELDAERKGDGTTDKVDGVPVPEVIAVNRKSATGKFVMKRQLGVTRVSAGRELDVKPTMRAPNKAKRRGAKCLDHVDEIRTVSGTEWAIDKAYVLTYTTDLDKFNSLGRVVQHQDHAGKPDGWQLRRIRCGSPLHQGGLRNGDVVMQVNGQAVGSIRQVLKAYRKSKRRDIIHVKVRRRGELLDLTYYIG